MSFSLESAVLSIIRTRPLPTGWCDRLVTAKVWVCRLWNPFLPGHASRLRIGSHLELQPVHLILHLGFPNLSKVSIRIRIYRQWNSLPWHCQRHSRLHLESPKNHHFRHFLCLWRLHISVPLYWEHRWSSLLLCKLPHFWNESHRCFWTKTACLGYLLLYCHYLCIKLFHLQHFQVQSTQRISKIHNLAHLRLLKTICCFVVCLQRSYHISFLNHDICRLY